MLQHGPALKTLYAKQNEPDKKRQILWSFLYEVPGIVKFIKMESRMAIAGYWGRGMESHCLMGTEIQFWRRIGAMAAKECKYL